MEWKSPSYTNDANRVTDRSERKREKTRCENEISNRCDLQWQLERNKRSTEKKKKNLRLETAMEMQIWNDENFKLNEWRWHIFSGWTALNSEWRIEKQNEMSSRFAL